VVVAAELLMPLNVRVPPGLGPPMYPTESLPEHPEHEMIFAPDARALVLDSASGVVSDGAALQVPAAAFMIQFTRLA
jgi:hypothetical protein